MKVLYCSKDTADEAYVKEKLEGFDVVFSGESVGTVPADTEVQVLCVFVDSGTVDGAVMDKFPNLKLIATRSTGYDHIDVIEAKKRGVIVCTVPTYGVHTVAEFAFALLLALARKVTEARARLKSEASFNQQGLTGFDLNGKTIGVVGTGSIGMHAVKIATGFGMRVLAHDVVQNEQVIAAGASYVPLDELLATSDIITLHVPYMPQTRHLLNRDAFAKMKRGSYLINTARGAIVDTEALIDALDTGAVAGAGLDVLEQETEITDLTKKLLAHPQVIVTPHVAFDTHEAIRRILDTTIENIHRFAAGTPTHVVVPNEA